MVGVDTLEAASTSPHVGGPWVTAVASSMRAVPSLVSALGRQSSSFQRVPAPSYPGEGSIKVDLKKDCPTLSWPAHRGWQVFPLKRSKNRREKKG